MIANPHLTRIAGVDALRECRATLAGMPDRSHAPLAACKGCGGAVSIRASRHREGCWILLHPKNDCAQSDAIAHVRAESLEEAVEKFLKL